MMLVTNILVLIQTITKFQYSIEKRYGKNFKDEKIIDSERNSERVNSELN